MKTCSTLSVVLGLALTLSQYAMGSEHRFLTEASAIIGSAKDYKSPNSAKDRAEGLWDCSTFVEAVLERSGLALSKAERDRVNIVLVNVTVEALAELVRKRDPRIQGVAAVVGERRGGARIQKIADAAPGDVVQLWRFTKDGLARGHSGIVVAVDAAGQRLQLRGAHTDGFQVKWFRVGEGTGGMAFPIFFIARWDGGKQRAASRTWSTSSRLRYAR